VYGHEALRDEIFHFAIDEATFWTDGEQGRLRRVGHGSMLGSWVGDDLSAGSTQLRQTAFHKST
jgi:hypothetical protein